MEIEKKTTQIAQKTLKNHENNVFLHIKSCVVCAKNFSAKRDDAKFCSSRCTKHHAKFILPNEIQAQKEAQELKAFEQKQKSLTLERLENQNQYEARKQQKELDILEAKEQQAKKINTAQIEAFAEKKAFELENNLYQKRQLKHTRRLRRFEVLAQHRHAINLRKLDYIAQIEIQSVEAKNLYYETKNKELAQMIKNFEKAWLESPEFHAFLGRIDTEKYQPMVNVVKSIADAIVKPQNQPQKQLEKATQKTSFANFGKK